MQDGYGDSSQSPCLSLQEQRRLEKAEWEKKYLKIRTMDQAIQKKIKSEWCQSACGFVPNGSEEHEICKVCHNNLYKEYLNKLGMSHLTEIIEKEFRCEPNTL